MITIFLGAGLSRLAGVPLASELFDEEPIVDRLTRANLVSRVLHRWNSWHQKTGGSPEEHLAHLASNELPGFQDAIWYVALLVTLRLAEVRYIGGQPQISRHHLTLTSGVQAIEDFWTTVFKQTLEVAVVTTNYDILAERGIRHEPRPRVPRPGFHYGYGDVELEGGGFPLFSHIRRIQACGSVPLLKLHGSVSWTRQGNSLVHYADCRPAIRGDAAIVAPAKEKRIPKYLEPTWSIAADVLRGSAIWLIVGYSLPEYDLQVRELLSNSAQLTPAIHVFDPSPVPAKRFEDLLPTLDVQRHPGIPDGLAELQYVLASQ